MRVPSLAANAPFPRHGLPLRHQRQRPHRRQPIIVRTRAQAFAPACRLRTIEDEMTSEPARIARAYQVQARRLDPLGLVYLWPRTG